MDNVYQIADKERQLSQKKKLLNTINLVMLPDKGAKLKCQIDDLEKDLQSLNLDLKLNPETSIEIKSTDELSNKSENSDVSRRYSDQIDPETNACKVKKEKNHDQKLGKEIPSESNITSFEELSRSASGKNIKTEVSIPNSSAFKSWRSEPSIKLIEPKPMHEKIVYKSKCTNFKTTVVYSLENEEMVKKLHHSLQTYPEKGLVIDEPLLLKTPLMKHQIDALSWLIWRESQQPSGGILADDMGLGKSLSIISLVLKQKECNNFFTGVTKWDIPVIKSTLIVCVASVVYQWQEEILKHCEDKALKVLVYHGRNRCRNIKEIMQHDVVITTYNIVLSEKKAMKERHQDSGLFSLHWERVVLDEAHTIKNFASQTAEAICFLKCFRKWCVTGTPIHNELKDLYSLVKFLQFTPFDDFNKWKKLTNENTASSNDRRNLLMKCILLRRTKSEVDDRGLPLIEMVKKTQHIIWITLNEEEEHTYNDVDCKVKELVQKCFNKPQVNTSSFLLVYLLRLQQCCSHVSLLKSSFDDSASADTLSDLTFNLSSLAIGENTEKSDACHSSLDLNFSSYKDSKLNEPTTESTKIKHLLNKLKEISEESKNTDKCVIVSQWVKMLDIVGLHLEMKKIPFYKIVGSTDSEDRQKMAYDFNNKSNSHKILLLSLKAGGVGLNLIGANHLFLLDLHWNPALELQACDRIHRVGQTKNVYIHKFVCKKTIEEKILSLQNEKSTLATSIWHGAGKVAKGLSLEDFRILFNIH